MGLSEPGFYHVQECVPNQDCILAGTVNNYRVAVLADGVSTCRCSGQGAFLACSKTRSFLLNNAEDVFEYDKESIAEYIVDSVYRSLCEVSNVNGDAPADYSSTLSAVLYDRRSHRLVCFHLGDGLILLANRKGCRALCIPGSRINGTAVTTTIGAHKVSVVVKEDISFDKHVLLCSDGAWENMYRKGFLKNEPLKYITKGRFNALDNYIRNTHPNDDYSYIAMKL